VKDAAIISLLRNVRQAEDVLSHLREGSLEFRRDRIAEALASSEWAAGPAQLLATYPHHALAEKNGILMRVRIEEEDGKIELGEVEVFDIPDKVGDVGAEVMETAKAAVSMILADDYDAAIPLVAGIANALNYKGDLGEQVATEVSKRSIQRDAWWHKVVREGVGEDAQIEIPAPRAHDLPGSVDDLRAALTTAAKSTAESIQLLSKAEGTSKEIEEAARDIAADMKYAIQALDAASRDDEAELAGVYEGVSSMASHLLMGAKFLSSLAEQDNANETKE